MIKAKKSILLFGQYWPFLAFLQLKINFYSSIMLCLAKLRYMQYFSPLLDYGKVLDQKWSQNVKPW